MSKFHCFSLFTKKQEQRTLKKALNIGCRKYQKRSQKGTGPFVAERSPKSQKSEPWAQSGAPSLQEGFPGTQNIQNH